MDTCIIIQAHCNHLLSLTARMHVCLLGQMAYETKGCFTHKGTFSLGTIVWQGVFIECDHSRNYKGQSDLMHSSNFSLKEGLYESKQPGLCLMKLTLLLRLHTLNETPCHYISHSDEPVQYCN